MSYWFNIDKDSKRFSAKKRMAKTPRTAYEKTIEKCTLITLGYTLIHNKDYPRNPTSASTQTCGFCDNAYLRVKRTQEDYCKLCLARPHTGDGCYAIPRDSEIRLMLAKRLYEEYKEANNI